MTTINVDAELSSVVDEESRDSPVTVTTEKASYIFKDPNFVVEMRLSLYLLWSVIFFLKIISERFTYCSCLK